LWGYLICQVFFAKEAVLATTFANYSFQGHFSYVIAVVAAIGTSFYSFKILHRVFLRKQNRNVTRSSMSHIHEPSIFMMTPLVILSCGSILSGYFLKDMFIGEGSDFWGNSIYGLPQHLVFFEAEYIPSYEKLIPVLASLYATSQYLTMYYASYSSTVLLKSPSSLSIFLRFNFFANKRWYFDVIYNDIINKSLFMFGYVSSFKTLDRGIVEIFGPYGLTLLIGSLSKEISRLQSGFIYHYAFVMLIGVTFYLTFIELDFFISTLFYSKLYIFLFGGILLILVNDNLRFK
jgi:NADH-ubiquinone oxidoreductase chain 5